MRRYLNKEELVSLHCARFWFQSISYVLRTVELLELSHATAAFPVACLLRQNSSITRIYVSCPVISSHG